MLIIMRAVTLMIEEFMREMWDQIPSHCCEPQITATWSLTLSFLGKGNADMITFYH